MTSELKELDTQLSKFIRQFYFFYNQLARHTSLSLALILLAQALECQADLSTLADYYVIDTKMASIAKLQQLECGRLSYKIWFLFFKI